MRKAYRSIQLSALAAACSFGFLATPQAQAAERRVLFEHYTATWCYYCQFAGEALTQMLGELDDITVFQVHLSDAFTTGWGNARANKYGVSGIPHVVVDGVRDRVGASNTAQAYNLYTYDYNWRLTIPTSVSVEVTATELRANVYNVKAEVSMDQDGTAATMEIHLIEALNNYPSSLPRDNYCLMQAYNKGQQTLQPGQTITVEQQFTLTAASQQNIERVQFQAFAQVPGAGNTEVFNSGVLDYPFADPCPADLDGDGSIGQSDLGILLSAYGQNDGGDIDGDGDTDQADLGALLGVYGTDC